MAQQQAGVGFRYGYDIQSVLEPWKEKLGDSFDSVVSRLVDRDRQIEDYTEQCVATFDQVLDEESTTSTTFTDLATVGPTCVVKLPRGRCIVTAGAYVTATVTNQTAVVGLSVDGAAASDFAILGNAAGGGGIAASVSATFLFTGDNGLTPGTHTFELKYLQSLPGPDVARFAGRFLLVDPVS